MTVSAAERKRLPASRKVGKGDYPMPDKKHAAVAKAFAAMHHDPRKAEIDRKANAILHPHGSGELPLDAYNAGYAGMGMDDIIGLQAAQQAQEAQQPPQIQSKKKKKGAQ